MAEGGASEGKGGRHERRDRRPAVAGETIDGDRGGDQGGTGLGEAAASFEDDRRGRAGHAIRDVQRLIGRLLEPAARRRGFAETRILAEWRGIVGDSLARRCQPIRLDYGRGAATGGTLHLRCSGGAALELQHTAPQIKERINDYFGFRAVARLAMVQAPLPRARPAPPPSAPRPLAAEEEAAVMEGVAGIGDSDLQAALADLGRAVRTRRNRP